MDAKYTIKEFTPLTSEKENLYKLCDLLDILFLEKDTDEPMPKNDFRIKNFRNKNPRFQEHWWLVWMGEEVVGFGLIFVRLETAASYEENKHVGYVQIRLDKSHRRKGIGLELTKLIVSKAKETGIITTLQSNTTYESGIAFCEKFNGILAMESAENRCRLNEVNWELMDEWRNQGQAKGKEENRRLQWFLKCPEDIIEEFCKVYTETMNQQPYGELETRPKTTPESRRKTEQEFNKLGYRWHTVLTREEDGTISGITDVTFIPDRPYRIEQELTGVLVKYRGKGLGKWLKSEMIFFIKKKYPEVKFISTGNADANSAMLSINTRMGFKIHEEQRSYKFKIADLEKRIAEIELIEKSV